MLDASFRQNATYLKGLSLIRAPFSSQPLVSSNVDEIESAANCILLLICRKVLSAVLRRRHAYGSRSSLLMR